MVWCDKSSIKTGRVGVKRGTINCSSRYLDSRQLSGWF